MSRTTDLWRDTFCRPYREGCTLLTISQFDIEPIYIKKDVVVVHSFGYYTIEETEVRTIIISDMNWLYFPRYFLVIPYDFEIEDTLVLGGIDLWIKPGRMTVRMLTWPLEPGFWDIIRSQTIGVA